MISTGKRSLVAVVLFIWACLSASSAFAAPVEDLNFGQWSLISIPADPGATGTVEALFGDDLPAAEYGINWLIYAFDSAANEYRLLTLDEPLEVNTGYWIFQRVADPAEVDVPDSLSALTGSDQLGCLEGQQCVAVPLTSNTNFPVWNAVGYSSDKKALFGETRFVTASGACADGCTPAEALTANVAQSVMFTLNSAGTAYEVIDEGTSMQPWDGYWLLALPDADQLRWVVPADFVLVDDSLPIVVKDDQYSGVSGQAVIGQAGDNDSLPEAAAESGLLLRITTQPQNGTIEFNPLSGAFTYVSADSFFGTDFFTYALVQIDQQGFETDVITDDARVQLDISAPVTFYRDPDYGGGAWSTTAGTFPDLADTPIPNNSISSIRVAPGFSIFACVSENFSNRCTTYRRDSRQLRSFNDQIVSVMVTRSEPDISFTRNGILSDYTVSGLSGVVTGDAVMSGAAILSERTRCASEGGICTLPDDGRYTVFYGVQGRYARIDSVSGSIACSDAVFGNPRPTVGKFCEYASEILTPQLALESNQGYVVTERPARGGVVMSPTGRYLYTPASKFAGTDTFQYALVRFNQTGGVAERLVEATVTLDYAGFLSFESEESSADNAIGTYELDAGGNPTNLQLVFLRSNLADFGEVVGNYRESPRMFLIRDAGGNATTETALEWDGGNAILVNGSAVPQEIIWDDARFNASGLDLVRYESTDDGELLIRFEDNLNGGDEDFNDTVMRLGFIHSSGQ